MTRYRFFTAVTLDGFLADEHDSLDWLLSQPTGEESILPYDAFVADVGAIVTGRSTYDWVREHEGAVEGAWVYTQPTFLFTHRAPAEVPEGITVVSGPPAEHRAAIEGAAGGKDVWIVGGGDLAAAFARAGMLDELFVSIAPVTLGAGKPLLGGRFDLELLEHGTNGALLEARYRVVRSRS
ncbi:dihydrofolate reductase family protein [Brachybacterium sp. NBEC-018]|uniref:dihydrofolate reductase family protein n=1 Tax=Brachybacterium sp. NBEC-018 TaxID=2996004 RepID=UPI0021756C7A|nr:dihydrofolate reductase family protein [Brachybacterium sp. NBEC-018]UVY84258.1 dihydrofolate reductase family protein [Brachybacterium sp. NBEC-018]